MSSPLFGSPFLPWPFSIIVALLVAAVLRLFTLSMDMNLPFLPHGGGRGDRHTVPTTTPPTSVPLEASSRPPQSNEPGTEATPPSSALPPPGRPSSPASPVSLNVSFRTDKIQLVRTVNQDGARVEFYRNTAYTCAKSGYYTFILAYRPNVPLSQRRPLWVHMHGGGLGTFLPGSTKEKPLYTPERHFPALHVEEDLGRLAAPLRDQGTLIALARDDAAGFRFLIPAYCDHDAYSGLGTVDRYNPFIPDENGEPRKVDGMLATRAALAFAKQRLNPDHVIIHGTSAGSTGGMAVVYTLGLEGKRLSGAILDAAVRTPYVTRNLQCNIYGEATDIRDERIGVLEEPEHLPNEAMARGDILTPLFMTGSRGDNLCCDEKVITATDIYGNTRTGKGCEILTQPVVDAVETYNPGGASRVHIMCVDDTEQQGLDCSLHTPTTDNPAENGGDRDRGDENYNRVIMEWVHARLRGPLPSL